MTREEMREDCSVTGERVVVRAGNEFPGEGVAITETTRVGLIRREGYERGEEAGM